jgi:hypothetical protein
MLNFNQIPSFFWNRSKQIINKIIKTTIYHAKSIYNYFIKNLFNFFFTKKIHNIKSLFAFDLDVRDLKKKTIWCLRVVKLYFQKY